MASKSEETKCGSINKQHYNEKGVLEDLACTLSAGHGGDHSAPYKKNVGEPVHDEKGRVVKTNYHVEDAVSFWGNAAQKPVTEIVEGEVAQMTLLQKDLVMQILNKNPNMSLPLAITQAKASDEWKAASEF